MRIVPFFLVLVNTNWKKMEMKLFFVILPKKEQAAAQFSMLQPV